MRFTGYSFGSIRVDGVTYGHDLIIDRGKIRKRKKAASRKFRGAYGHTPLSAAEDIPWRCRRLVVGTGADGALPALQQVRDEARRRKVDLVVLPHGGGDRRAGQGHGGHQRHLAPDLLNLPGAVPAAHLSGCVRSPPLSPRRRQQQRLPRCQSAGYGPKTETDADHGA